MKLFEEGLDTKLLTVLDFLYYLFIQHLISLKNTSHLYISANYFKFYGQYSKLMYDFACLIGLICISAIAGVVF